MPRGDRAGKMDLTALCRLLGSRVSQFSDDGRSGDHRRWHFRLALEGVRQDVWIGSAARQLRRGGRRANVNSYGTTWVTSPDIEPGGSSGPTR